MVRQYAQSFANYAATNRGAGACTWWRPWRIAGVAKTTKAANGSGRIYSWSPIPDRTLALPSSYAARRQHDRRVHAFPSAADNSLKAVAAPSL